MRPARAPTAFFLIRRNARAHCTVLDGRERVVDAFQPISMRPFMHAQIVAFAVLEPGRLVRAQHADVVDSLEIGKVVILEHHTLRFEVRNHPFDGLDLEAQRSVLGLGALGLGDERDVRIAAAAHPVRR